jgi:cytochrome c553
MRPRTRAWGRRLAAAAPGLVWLAAVQAHPPPVEQQCLDCHRAGVAPIVEGQHAEYLATQLRRFRDTHRDSFPMSPLAGGMDDAEAREWADALTAHGWPPSARATGSAAEREAGHRRTDALGCTECHGAEWIGGAAIPRVAGQRSDYLERQLREFDAGRRYHPPVAGGTPLRVLRGSDAADIAAYLSSVGAPGTE